MSRQGMDAILDPTGVMDHMDGVDYRDYKKKESKPSNMTLNPRDMWNGKRTNSNLLECLMAIYLLCNTHSASYTVRLQYLLLGGWATDKTCKVHNLKETMSTTFNTFTRERPKPTRPIGYIEFPNTAQGRLVKETADNKLAKEILIWHRIAYFTVTRMIVDMFLPVIHWQEVEHQLNNIPDQKSNEPHANFANRVLSMAQINNNLALALHGNLLNLWYVMGPIKLENPEYNELASETDADYEPEFLLANDCLEVIPDEGDKPAQNTIVGNKKFVGLLTKGMSAQQLVEYIDNHYDNMSLQRLMEKLRNADDKSFARNKRALPVSNERVQRYRVGMVGHESRGRGSQSKGRGFGAKGKGRGRVGKGIPDGCPTGVCYNEFRKRGSCKREPCHFSHDISGTEPPAPTTERHSVAAVRAIMDSLSDAERAAVLAPDEKQGNAPRYGGFAIIMNVALATTHHFAQAMLNPILSIFNKAFTSMKLYSNSGTAMINTAVYGHSKEEHSVLKTLVDTGAGPSLITLSIFDEFIKNTPASVSYRIYGNSNTTVCVADNTSMAILGHVAFNLYLSPTHNLVIHAGIVTELPAGLDFIFGMTSLRSLGVVIDTRYSENTPYGFVQFHEVGAVMVPIIK